MVEDEQKSNIQKWTNDVFYSLVFAQIKQIKSGMFMWTVWAAGSSKLLIYSFILSANYGSVMLILCNALQGSTQCVSSVSWQMSAAKCVSGVSKLVKRPGTSLFLVTELPICQKVSLGVAEQMVTLAKIRQEEKRTDQNCLLSHQTQRFQLWKIFCPFCLTSQ